MRIIKMFDKNNWYIDCNKLTDGRYKEVCTFLRMHNIDEDNSWFGVHVTRISLGLINKSQLANKPQYAGVIDGLCNIQFRKCKGDVFKGVTEITYYEFLECVLNKNNISSSNESNVSNGDVENMQTDIKEVFKHIVELCDACQITLSFNGNRVEVFSEIGEWYVDLNEEDTWDKLLKIAEAIKVLSEAKKL